MQKQFVLSQLRQKDPKKAAELERDPAAFTAMMEAEQKRHRILADPTSIEAQQAIEESIRQENVLQNLKAALEANPESFGHIDMLYIRCAVDGHAIDAFVDTGAQATISNWRACRRFYWCSDLGMCGKVWAASAA